MDDQPDLEHIARDHPAYRLLRGLSANGLHTPFGQRHRFRIRRDEVATARAFLSQLEPSKRGAKISSYHLKHCAERWGQTHGMCGYVSNGAALVAAVELGLKIRPWPPTPNAGIGILKRSLATETNVAVRKSEGDRVRHE